MRKPKAKLRGPKSYQREINKLKVRINELEEHHLTRASTEDLVHELRSRVTAAHDAAEAQMNRMDELGDALDGDFSHIEELD
jgi:predicted  nucleic acid-binding Zn-ribbon protein